MLEVLYFTKNEHLSNYLLFPEKKSFIDWFHFLISRRDGKQLFLNELGLSHVNKTSLIFVRNHAVSITGSYPRL